MAYRLVCFDLDGTIIANTTFVWKTLHEQLESDSQRREEAKEQYFAGKLSYHDWAVHDAQLWVEKDVTKKDIMDALAHLRLVKGARETLQRLKEKGVKIALISGSVDVALEKVLPDYKDLFDDVYINVLTFDKKRKLTGIIPTQHDFDRKANALREIAEREGILLEETVFVGDHNNDVAAAKIAGLSIAFNCKEERLLEVCDHHIEEQDLSLILPLLGISR